MADGINCDTNLTLCADDTKIWRKIVSDEDNVKLQKDIDFLYSWSIENKMYFHPDKCKVVSIKNRSSPLSVLPFTTFYYHLGEEILSSADQELDLGVVININFSFNEQCEQLISRANQQYGLLRRNCYFIHDIKKRKILYLARVRSQFEHCEQIWRPTTKTMIDKFESIQKNVLNGSSMKRSFRTNRLKCIIGNANKLIFFPYFIGSI